MRTTNTIGVVSILLLSGQVHSQEIGRGTYDRDQMLQFREQAQSTPIGEHAPVDDEMRNQMEAMSDSERSLMQKLNTGQQGQGAAMGMGGDRGDMMRQGMGGRMQGGQSRGSGNMSQQGVRNRGGGQGGMGMRGGGGQRGGGYGRR